MFKVADVVHISSGPYTFKLDRKEELGMITPIWTPSLAMIPGSTVFTLDLSKSADPEALAAHLKDIKPSLLLFLRKLRSLTIQGPLDHHGHHATIEIRREDIGPDLVSLRRVYNGKSSADKYFMVSQIAETFTEEKKRLKVIGSTIVLAFPLIDSEEPKIDDQAVHAFLPLRSYGFKVRTLTQLLMPTLLTRDAVYHSGRLFDFIKQRQYSIRSQMEHCPS